MQTLLYFHNDHKTAFRVLGCILAVLVYPFVFLPLLVLAIHAAKEEDFSLMSRLEAFGTALAIPFILVFDFEQFCASGKVYDTRYEDMRERCERANETPWDEIARKDGGK